MPTLAERLQTAVELEEANAAKAQAIIQGPATGGSSTVSTTNGPVKTVAKLINDADIALAAAVAALEESATTSAAAAAASASAAAASATAASGSATTATTQAGIATTQAGNAATSASAAATSASAAAGSATTAGTHSTNAGNSANAASTSATNSANSASASATSASAAAASATLAQDWATKTAATVSGGEFSAKEYAMGTQAGTGGSAKNWATQTGSDVTGAAALSRSAKSWAQEALTGATYGGSAKDWAQSASLPDGTNKSAKSYALDASASAVAAASSAATAASIAAGLNFKGTQAGASVPSTSAASGDCYLIISTGTSQSKTWALFDLAIYNGSSGSWTQVSNALWAGLSASLTMSREVKDAIMCDGATSNRRCEWTPGAVSSALGGQALTFPLEFQVPTAASGTTPRLVLTSSTATNLSINGFDITLNASGGLEVEQAGNPTSNVRYLTYGGFRAAYSGQWIRMLVVFEAPNTTTNPKIYVNGIDITASFSLTTLNTPPNWMPATFECTKYVVGLGALTSHRFVPHGPILGAFTAAEALEWAQTGRWPSWCEFALTSNPVTAIYTSDFSAGVNSWGSTIGGATGNVDSIGGEDDWLRQTANGSTPVDLFRTTSLGFNRGQRIRIKARIRHDSATVGYIRIGYAGGSGIISRTITMAANTTTDIDEVMVVAPDTGIFIGFADNTGSPVAGTNGENLYVKNIQLFIAGALIRPVIQPGSRCLRDASPSGVPGYMTGFFTLSDKDDGKYAQQALTANGEFLDTGGIINIDALLVDVVIRNTTANIVYGFALGNASGGDQLTYRTDIPASGYVVLPIKLAELAGLTVGTTPFGRVYFSATNWNSGSLNISIRYRRERGL